MKKVINRKLYDTETAEELHFDGYGCGNDFDHWREDLYRTKSGNLFLHGRGGPRSRYVQITGKNEMSGGSDIRPMTTEEAIDWLENQPADTMRLYLIIAEFPDQITEA